MQQRHRMSQYGVGVRFSQRYLAFVGLAPTQCVVGLIWSSSHFELCFGPLVIGVLRVEE